jgi:hypothetical protein
MTALPNSNVLGNTGTTQGTFRTAIEALRSFVAESLGGSPEEAISLVSDAMTPTVASVVVDTQSAAASDNLSIINATNFPNGRFLMIRPANAARVVNVLHNNVSTGRIITQDGQTAVLDATNKYMLLQHNAGAGQWVEVFRSWGPWTTFGKSLIAAADAAAVRLLLGGATGVSVKRTNGADEFAVATGTDALALTLPNFPAAPVEGMNIAWRSPNANTAAVTMNVNGTGAKALVHFNGDALAAGDIPAASIIEARYHAATTSWRIMSGSAGAVKKTGDTMTGALTATNITATGVMKANGNAWNNTGFKLANGNDIGLLFVRAVDTAGKNMSLSGATSINYALVYGSNTVSINLSATNCNCNCACSTDTE